MERSQPIANLEKRVVDEWETLSPETRRGGK